MRSKLSRKMPNPNKEKELFDLKNQLQSIEEKLSQMQNSLEKMESQPAQSVPGLMNHHYFDPFQPQQPLHRQEAFIRPTDSNPNPQQTADSNGVMDGLLGLMNDPRVSDALQKLTEAIQTNRKPKRRSR